ncbi:winged helix-turn-helix domain-containing protein [Thermococcus sp. M36]|uniref:helix-turn-helix transcriptional regulator n=1 Tax=Thermococcus sp. M36 TaxID=1638261 RepID=UPI00143B14D2|nr:winged helix-turn-helix domain-containing protein [Thermococcus sp. M36]NJE06163.1 winged helix-turn-helix domain-containing protein [Thermococcus sp. M36]
MELENMLKMIVTSSVRYRVLLALSGGAKTLGEIHAQIGSTKSTISHALSDLLEEMLVAQDPETKRYRLTNIGRLVSIQLKNVSEALESIEKFKDFWLSHDLSGIPENLLLRVGDLKDSKLHRPTPEYIRLPHEVYMELIKTSDWIKGVSPILFSDYPDEFLGLAFREDVEIEIITTRSVYRKLIELSSPEAVEKVQRLENVRIYVIEENPRIAFTVTNNFLSLGLFFSDGTYDMMADLISTSERAKKWGIELFEYYRKKAERVM